MKRSAAPQTERRLVVADMSADFQGLKAPRVVWCVTGLTCITSATLHHCLCSEILDSRDPYLASDFRSVKCDGWKLEAPEEKKRERVSRNDNNSHVPTAAQVRQCLGMQPTMQAHSSSCRLWRRGRD
ncbi:hypothetical protein KUCAC02_019796 [Chaenocephalus aceratus]|uniref:Uncharacterized protein n=1 Tax=Chaenocephalus aceratus TaxID=36190 RepID=A0ACB9VQ39_CHAAC|nr:hypothetical protein KUCAC02_019796 [Chaenocephalus aceratus]